MAGSHDKSEWILYESNNLSSEIAASREDAINKTVCPQSIMDAMQPSKTYTLTLRYHDATNNIWSEKGSIEFTTSADYDKPHFVFTMKNKINLSKMFKWFNQDEFSVYVNGVEKPEIAQNYKNDYPLSPDGDKIEIKNKLGKDNYPFVWFAGTEGSLKDCLLSVDAPLPLLRDKSDGAACTRLGGTGDTMLGSSSTYESNPQYGDGLGVLSFCVSLIKICNGLLKYNPQVTELGGLGKDGASDNMGVYLFGGRGFGFCSNCDSLEYLPEDLLYYTPNLISLGGKAGNGGDGRHYLFTGSGDGGHGLGAFSNNKKLKAIPEHFLDKCPKITTLGGINGNGGDGTTEPDEDAGNTTFSNGMDGGNATGAFANNPVLASVPEDLLKYQTLLTNLGGQGGTGGNGYGYGSSGSNGIGGKGGAGNALTGAGGNGGGDGSSGMFSNCPALTVSVRVTSTQVNKAVVFAKGTAAKGTVYVPSSSTTASTFKNESSANVNVIEE